MASTAIPRRQIFVRPRSEVITVLDWQQVSSERPERWRSETCLDAEFFESEERKFKAGYVCGSYEFTRERLGESDSEMIQDVAEAEFSENNPEAKRSVLTVNLKPTSVQVKPRLVKAQSMASLPRKVELGNYDSQDKVQQRSGINGRKDSALDVSLAKLRHEMNSLRRQDLVLLEQLLNLNNSIQDFKLSQYALPSDSSDEYDQAEIAMEKPLKPKRWLSRESLGSNESDHAEIAMEKPLKPKRWSSRGSLGSNGIDHAGIAMEKPLKPKRLLSRGSLSSDDSDQAQIAMEKPLKPKRWLSRGSLGSYDSDQAEIAMEKPLKPKRWLSRGSLGSNGFHRPEIAMEKPLKPKRWRSRGSLGSDDSDQSEIAMEKPLTPKRWFSRGSLGSDGSDYQSGSSWSSVRSESIPSLSDIASYDSGHESGAGLKSCRRRSKSKFGSMDLRRVSFETVMERNGSEVFVNGSVAVFPAQAVRRNSDFRVAEIKSIGTLSKRQSTIW